MNPALCGYLETSLLTHSPVQELLIRCLINTPYHAFSDEINSWVLFCKQRFSQEVQPRCSTLLCVRPAVSHSSLITEGITQL